MTHAELFYSIGEYFAAGFFELEGASVARMYCRAYRRLYENCPLMEYPAGAPLYPVRDIHAPELAVSPNYCRQFDYDREKMASKSPEAAELFDAFAEEHVRFWEVEGYSEASRYFNWLDAWNHSVLNFKRITAEGIDGYEKRIRAMQDEDLKAALLDVVEGIRAYHDRALGYLSSVGAEEKLIAALRRVPFAPARTAYEALVSANFTLCFDGCDDIGHADGWLDRYWRGEDLTPVMRQMLRAVNDSGGWTIAVGPDYSDLTKQWLRASRGLAKPMVELRTTKDMPEDIWQEALETVLSGGGQPSFYHEEAIQSRLRERLPEAPAEDIFEFSGMGCTETCFCGLTLCGGIDANLNVLRVFEDTMETELEGAESFEAFYEAFTRRLRRAQDALVRLVDNYYQKRAEISFAPIRTLFIDDCIEKEKGYYQGGARYTFAMPADSGIPNTVDSLMAVKHLVFEEKRYTPAAFLASLRRGDNAFRSELRACPSYGVADPEADSLMRDLTGRFYAYYRKAKLKMGIGFFPTSHQFVRHVGEGQLVGATPDGRSAGDALSDSIAAVNGKALDGPTAMLRSAASFVQREVYGIPVLNLSITQKFPPEVLRALIETYFEMDGTQIQITCTTRETLLEAQKEPEKHRDLIVRVGGYSAYFCTLDEGLQNAVIARTVFE